MSKLPFASSPQSPQVWDKSYVDSGSEASSSNAIEYIGQHSQQDIDNDLNSVDDQDDLNETGDIGVGQQVYASYQKSGHKPLKGKDQLKMTDTLEDDDFVNINSSLKSTRQRPPAYTWLRHPKVRENWKTVAGAIFLLTIGILFLICGIVLAAIPDHDGPKAVIFFVCAAVCILPGGYHTIYIYRATKGWRGYTFESLPSFQ